MNGSSNSAINSRARSTGLGRVLWATLISAAALGLAACGNNERIAAQPLARVNGIEITLKQVADEMKRAGIKPEQQEAATKQLLDSLIDRQLILAEAMRHGVARNADVAQAIERARMQIVSRAYLKGLDARITKPSLTEIDAYYHEHPEYFTQRKQFDLNQLLIATRDFSDDLRLVVASAKSLGEVAAWLDKHSVRYVRGELSRSTTDVPEQMAARLEKMQEGQIFIVKEGEYSLINLITKITITPITAKTVLPQIEQYLFNKRLREAAEGEITRLRASAKIEYLNMPAHAVHQGNRSSPESSAKAKACVGQENEGSARCSGYADWVKKLGLR